MILGHADTRTDAERMADARNAFNRGMVASKKLETLTVGEIQKGQRAMSLVDKMKALTERQKDFVSKTSDAFDRIMAKMDEGEKKRDEAEQKHTAHIDGIIKAAQESIDVVDRLSNLPLGGESSTGG